MIRTLLIFAQTQAPNLMGLPNPTASETDAGTWWPFIMAMLSLLVAAVSAAFAAWVKLTEKKVDKSAKDEAERTKIEIEQLKLEFEQRKQFETTLQNAFQSALTEGKALRDELRKALTDIHSRDQIIAELRGTVNALKARIRSLEDCLVPEVEVETQTVKTTKLVPPKGAKASDTLRDRVVQRENKKES